MLGVHHYVNLSEAVTVDPMLTSNEARNRGQFYLQASGTVKTGRVLSRETNMYAKK